MNALVNNILLERSLQAFCWMLIHSLWQGLLLALVTGIVMLLTNKAKAETRYALTTGLFFTFLAVCCGTYIYEWNNGFAATDSQTAKTGFGNIALLQHYGIDGWPAALAQYCSSHATYIVLGWFAIFTFRCWQMSRAFSYIRRVRTSNHRSPGVYWQNKISTLTQQLQIKRTVTMLESGITKVPVVIGHLKPVIYMPLGLLANLPPDQVEAVLLHELAHIRRNDYLVNLLQNMAESVFFFNPGLLWVSSLVKQEREHCCDDVALAHTGNKKQFIQALISFKEHVIYGNSQAVAFPGKKSHLLQRVTRIVYNRNNTLSGGEKIFLLGSLLICFALLGAMTGGQATPVVAVKEPVKEITAAILLPLPQPAATPVSVKEKKTTPVKRNTTTARRIPTTVSTQVIQTELAMNAQSSHEQTVEIAQRQREEEMKVASHTESQADRYRRQAEQDHQQAMRDREQAAKDRAQADRDRERANIDRQRAEQDRAQAERDRLQADRDRAQADKDREQAERDRAQADRDRAQANEHRRQADRDRKQFEQKRVEQLRNTATPLYTNP
jgi:beta-lactamase regulating signal transducer with metallopeptidase domain/cell division septum initiation protein DivIVA